MAFSRDALALTERVEADGLPSPKLRITFEAEDAASMTQTRVDAGANLITSPRETSWRSLNSRLDAPADPQVTLFEERD